MAGLRWRFALASLIFLIALIYVLPSLPFVKNSSLSAFLPEKVINLGLDLKGGIHLTLGVEVEKAVANALVQAGQDIRVRAREEGIAVLRPRVINDNTLEFIVPRANQQVKLDKMLTDFFANLEFVEPQPMANGQLRYIATYTQEYVLFLSNFAQEQALRTIRNRIDQFGVAEPDIRKQAGYRIQIQLPGISDSQRAIKLIGQTALLGFHIVDDDVDPYRAILPSGLMALPFTDDNNTQADSKTGRQMMLVVDKNILLTGEEISDARPSFDDNNQAYVTLAFNSRGSRIFDRITAENVGKRMAIVLDGKIYSAPVIRERITGGQASISGDFTTSEAQDLAIILRSGSLPAPVHILEERVVGPSLGQESIDSGLFAAAIGSLAVIIFMALYYGISGVIADMMLIFTVVLVFAGMAAFGATLTLPGIAGIILTIGMSVDANVLIFERIREEIHNGLSPLAAVKAGFERANVSIFDSNITTIIATSILYQFGTGPIRGFAITLSLGVLASMFTAVFVSRAIFECWARRSNVKSLSI